MDIDTPARQLLFATVLVEAHGASGTQFGTAFLYDGSKQEGKPAPLLVSNRHVFADADELVFTFIKASGEGMPLLGHGIIYKLQRAREAVFTAKDPNVDLAVIAAANMLNQMTAAGDAPFFRMLGQSLLPTAEILADLDAVEEVTFVGYPNAIYDQVNLTPIIRRGTTATPIQYDYNGAPTFVIDAAVFPGSSGSPVLIINTDGYRQNNTYMMASSRVIFLGVVAAVHLARSNGRLTPTATPSVEVDVPMGLGIVYRWDAVEEMVDDFFKQAGQDRSGVETTSLVPLGKPDVS